jgi:hypothetical protein
MKGMKASKTEEEKMQIIQESDFYSKWHRRNEANQIEDI